jgi:hypothetical protein
MDESGERRSLDSVYMRELCYVTARHTQLRFSPPGKILIMYN